MKSTGQLMGGPTQRGTQIPRAATKRLAGQHKQVVIGDHRHLLPIGQIDTDVPCAMPDRLTSLLGPVLEDTYQRRP
jgi:hypothetical protein